MLSLHILQEHHLQGRSSCSRCLVGRHKRPLSHGLENVSRCIRLVRANHRGQLTRNFGTAHATEHGIHDVSNLSYKDVALLEFPGDMFCQSRPNEGRSDQVCPDTTAGLLGVLQNCLALITNCLELIRLTTSVDVGMGHLTCQIPRTPYLAPL